MMRDVGLSIEEVISIERGLGVSDTPQLELRNITALAKTCKTGICASIRKDKPPQAVSKRARRCHARRKTEEL